MPALGFWYRTDDDVPPGWAHLLEHLVHAGLEQQYPEFWKELRSAGGFSQSITCPDGIGFVLKGPEAILRQIPFAEMHHLPVITTEVFKQELAAVIEEFVDCLRNSQFCRQSAALRMALTPSRYAEPVIGTVDSLAGVSLSALVRLRDQVVCSDRLETFCAESALSDSGRSECETCVVVSHSDLQVHKILETTEGDLVLVCDIEELPKVCAVSSIISPGSWNLMDTSEHVSAPASDVCASFHSCGRKCILMIRQSDHRRVSEVLPGLVDRLVDKRLNEFREELDLCRSDSFSVVVWDSIITLSGFRGGFSRLSRALGEIRSQDILEYALSIGRYHDQYSHQKE